MPYDLSEKRIYVAGHQGMVGSAIVRRLQGEGCTILTADRSVDLREQAAVRDWFPAIRPDAVGGALESFYGTCRLFELHGSVRGV